MGCPLGAQRELLLQGFPVVPEVPRDPPQVRLFPEVRGGFQGSRSRREAQDDLPGPLFKGIAQAMDLLLPVGAGDVIRFDVIHAPGAV